MSIPVRIVSIDGDEADVEAAGRRRRISLSLLRLERKPVAVGDWVLAHTGLAVERIDEDDARRLLRELDEQGGTE